MEREKERGEAALAEARAEAATALKAAEELLTATLESSKQAALEAAAEKAAQELEAASVRFGEEKAKALEEAAEEKAKALEDAARLGEEALALRSKELEDEREQAVQREVELKEAALKGLGEAMQAEMAAALADLGIKHDKELAAQATSHGEAMEKLKSAAAEKLKAERDRVWAEAKELYLKENKARKLLHNKLMDLQGNIRVMARVRPMLQVEEKSGRGVNVAEYPTDEDITVSKDDVTQNSFEFDRVFRPDSSQESVFAGVQPLITSVLDGYNVCIFAYGQTGSGKTFTMEGSAENPGVNSRALTELFRLRDEMLEDMDYSFQISMLEIYNETVRDLLVQDSKVAPKLEIRQQNNSIVVPGLTEVAVDGMDEVMAQLAAGKLNRAVGSHDMNEHSSRSHMIFSVKVLGHNKHTGARVRSKLHLIDLAGSERISKTDAVGDRLKEAQNINRSLSALGDVIAALSNKQGHVPFRNSKLTYLLQDALAGNSKVMMFVNASPAQYNVGETLCSLTFAARCRAVELGGAKKNVVGGEVSQLKRVIESLEKELL
ncbi:unnamed protein product, partial [Chrysoparadoxa australica]